MIFAVQFADAAREVPQVLLKIKKSPGFAPVKVMLPMVIAAAPLFVRVTTFWAPLPPTGTDTQFRAAGETDTCAMAARTLHDADSECDLHKESARWQLKRFELN